MVVITQQDAAERLSPVFKGRRGKLLFDLAAGMTGIAKVNALHDRVDTVVKTMLETGHDLPRLYRETSVGGLSRFVRR